MIRPHVGIPALLLVLLAVALATGGCHASAGAGRPAEPAALRILWYDAAAAEWYEALPVGNGRLGAMVHGSVGEEHLQLNEDTLYAGEPGPVGAVPIHRYVDEAFALVRAGKYEEADRFVSRHMLGRNHQTYTTLGR